MQLIAADKTKVRLSVDADGLCLEDRPRPLLSKLRYHDRRFRDELEIAGERFVIPAGKGTAVQALIAGARLGPALQPPSSQLVEKLDASPSYWLGHFMKDAHSNERVLAVLSTSLRETVESEIGASENVSAWFVRTNRRAVLVAVGAFGDVWRQDLRAPIDVRIERGRDRVRSGESEWLTSRTNETRYAEVASWQAANVGDGGLRLALDAALDNGEHERAKELASALTEDPSASVAFWLQQEGTPPALLSDFERTLSPADVTKWTSRWKLGAAQNHRLIAALSKIRPSSILALRLHATLHEASRLTSKSAKSESDLGPSVAVEIAWAEHQNAAGRSQDAQKTLDETLALLAGGDAMDLVPHLDADRFNPQIKARLSILEALRRLFTGKTRERATLAIARLQPLLLNRIEALHACVEGDLADRASVVGSLLTGNIRRRGLAPPEISDALTDDQLALLRHPVGRTDEFIGMVSSYVASVDLPDHSALKAYCPRLKKGALRDIFERAASRMTVESDIFVSQGEHAIGCRAHEGTESGFVILGGDHLDPDAERALGPAELAFVFGCELTHLRFGHARVTSGEFWKGAFDLGVSGFDILVGTIPLLGRYRIGEGLSKVANAFKDGTAQKVASRARKLLGDKTHSEQPAEDVEVNRDFKDDQLIAAHRLMQFTADRAGLLLCGHPAAAIYAMLALDPSDALTACNKDGLATTLNRTTEDGPTYPELAVRVSALLSFWLSDDYASLSAA